MLTTLLNGSVLPSSSCHQNSASGLRICGAERVSSMCNAVEIPSRRFQCLDRWAFPCAIWEHPPACVQKRVRPSEPSCERTPHGETRISFSSSSSPLTKFGDAPRGASARTIQGRRKEPEIHSREGRNGSQRHLQMRRGASMGGYVPQVR